mgnify:CR=1 FL=1
MSNDVVSFQREKARAITSRRSRHPKRPASCIYCLPRLSKLEHRRDRYPKLVTATRKNLFEIRAREDEKNLPKRRHDPKQDILLNSLMQLTHLLFLSFSFPFHYSLGAMSDSSSDQALFFDTHETIVPNKKSKQTKKNQEQTLSNLHVELNFS